MPAAWQNSSWTTQVFQSVCPFRQVDAVFGPVFVCGHVLLPPFRSRRTAVLGGCKWSIILLSLFVRATCPSLRASGVSYFSDVVTLENNSSDTGKRPAKHSADSFPSHFCGFFFSCFSYFSGLFWTFWMLVHHAHRTHARHNTAPDTHSTQDSNTWHATQINTPPHTAHIRYDTFLGCCLSVCCPLLQRVVASPSRMGCNRVERHVMGRLYSASLSDASRLEGCEMSLRCMFSFQSEKTVLPTPVLQVLPPR